MCLVAFAYRTDPRYDLVLIANRDEFFNRPAEPAHFWPGSGKDTPQVLAGKDIQGGGTWMGVTRDGRFALLTNFRDPSRIRTNVKSRGLLVSDFLKSNLPAREYLESVRSHVGDYNDFNLVAGSPEGVFYLSTRASELGETNKVQEIKPGVYGVSNHLFETPWPKVVRARNELEKALKQSFTDENSLKEKLFKILADPTQALNEHLPETGVGLEKERALSSIFITMPSYGTRCSTLLLMKPNGEVDYSERSYSSDRALSPSTVEFHFTRSTGTLRTPHKIP